MKSDTSILGNYFKDLFQYAGVKAYLSLGLLVVLGLTQGVGLFMLVPLLDIVGISGEGKTDILTRIIRPLMEYLGLPLTLPVILCVYAAVVTLYAVITRYYEVINASVINGFTRYWRNRLYEAIGRMEWTSFVQAKTSDMIHLLSTEMQRIGQGTQQLLQLLGTTVIGLVHLGVALTVSVPMTMIVLACGAGLLLFLRPYNRKAHQAGQALFSTMGEMHTAVTEHLSGMKMVKSYGVEERHSKNFQEITSHIARQSVRFVRIYTETAMYFQIGAAVTLGLLFYGAIGIFKIPPADLILLIFLFARLLPKVSLMQKNIQHVGNVLPSYEGVLLMYERFKSSQKPFSTISGPSLSLEKDLVLRQVGFSYDHAASRPPALRNVDLIIPAGSMVALIGPSGSGKSTLADIIMGLLEPDEGMVLLDGQPLEGERRLRWRHSVGYVPQETFLFHDTVRSNLVWAKENARDEELWWALNCAAAEFVSRLPEGLDTVVGDRGVRLSGGERQRIALARALLRKPSLLLLDEATSNLDRENEKRIHDVVTKLRGDLTILMITHRRSAIRGVDKIVVLDQGQIVDAQPWK